MRKNLTSVFILSCLFIPLTLKASDKVDMESFKRVGESIATGKQGLLTSHTSSGGTIKFTGEDGNNNISVSDAISFKGTDIKEKNYNAGNMYEAAREMANDPKSEHAEVVKDGFLRGKEFEVLNSDNFLDKARDVQANPEQYVDFLSGKYSDCEVKSEEIMDKKEVSCDEYTVHQSHMCSVGRKIEVDAKHNYICKKERKTYEKKCSKELKLKCKKVEECEAGGIILTSLASDMKWVYQGMVLTLGTIANNYWSGNCDKYSRSTKFEVRNKDLIEEFRIIQVGYDDYMRVTINGIQVYIGPEAGNQLVIEETKIWKIRSKYVNTGTGVFNCERNTNWQFNTNIDLKPYLKEGDNQIDIEVIVKGHGEGWVQIKTKQHCCKEWEETWEESCEGNK